ncbi:MAG: glycine cleavage system protein H, partial [Paenisporosarcina sp.]
YAPISGKVVEVNSDLEDSPEFVNESPYENAWMVVIEPTDVTEIDSLMTAEQYEKMTQE